LKPFLLGSAFKAAIHIRREEENLTK